MPDWIFLLLFPVTVLSASFGITLFLMAKTRKVRLIGWVLIGIAIACYCIMEYQTDPLLHGRSLNEWPLFC